MPILVGVMENNIDELNEILEELKKEEEDEID
jgi:hypothetical protein